MSPEQLDLARRLAAHRRFVWREGMAARERSPTGNWQPGDYEWRILSGAPDVAAVTSEGDMHEAPYMPSAFAIAVPDLTDAATGGVLLDMLGPMHVVENIGVEFGVPAWRVRGLYFDDGPFYVGNTLAEACARALLAEWATASTPETT